MKLLFDQNLSYKLCAQLADLFPQSDHVRLLGMDKVDDRAIWQYAKANDSAAVIHDSDFADLAALYGPPPKVIWLRCGNQPTEAIEQLLRDQIAVIAAFADDVMASCLEIH